MRLECLREVDGAVLKEAEVMVREADVAALAEREDIEAGATVSRFLFERYRVIVDMLAAPVGHERELVSLVLAEVFRVGVVYGQLVNLARCDAADPARGGGPGASEGRVEAGGDRQE